MTMIFTHKLSPYEQKFMDGKFFYQSYDAKRSGSLARGVAISKYSVMRFLSIIKTMPREYEYYTTDSSKWFIWKIER